MISVLIADDEPILRKNLGRFLESLGYHVRLAANGKEAVAAMDERAPDVLLTDLNMPDMDGFEILTQLRARGSPLPVIAMSGGGRFDKALLLDSAAALGALITLQKPFELDELRDAIAEVLLPRQSGAGGQADAT
jgi:CheY-like chemotaxis protein